MNKETSTKIERTKTKTPLNNTHVQNTSNIDLEREREKKNCVWFS